MAKLHFICGSRRLLSPWLLAATFMVSAPVGAAQTEMVVATPSPATAAIGPVGDWYTIHDETKKATSVVRISLEGNALVGRVVEVLASKGGPNPLCERCEGERRGKPIVGMVILGNLTGKNDSFDGGYVIDPSSGKQYRAKVKMRDINTLELRGFIGISAFGRTQVWQRVVVADREQSAKVRP